MHALCCQMYIHYHQHLITLHGYFWSTMHGSILKNTHNLDVRKYYCSCHNVHMETLELSS